MGYVLEVTYKHGQGTRVLRTASDIDAFVEELLGAGPDYTSATVYAIDEETDADPEHELVIGVDQQSGLGAVRYAGTDGEWFSQGESTNPDGVKFLYYGTAHDFPADSEVPLGIVRQALSELLSVEGQRPESVTWQPWA